MEELIPNIYLIQRAASVVSLALKHTSNTAIGNGPTIMFMNWSWGDDLFFPKSLSTCDPFDGAMYGHFGVTTRFPSDTDWVHRHYTSLTWLRTYFWQNAHLCSILSLQTVENHLAQVWSTLFWARSESRLHDVAKTSKNKAPFRNILWVYFKMCNQQNVHPADTVYRIQHQSTCDRKATSIDLVCFVSSEQGDLDLFGLKKFPFVEVIHNQGLDSNSHMFAIFGNDCAVCAML